MQGMNGETDKIRQFHVPVLASLDFVALWPSLLLILPFSRVDDIKLDGVISQCHSSEFQVNTNQRDSDSGN